jgi:hypothetical protein
VAGDGAEATSLFSCDITPDIEWFLKLLCLIEREPALINTLRGISLEQNQPFALTGLVLFFGGFTPSDDGLPPYLGA